MFSKGVWGFLEWCGHARLQTPWPNFWEDLTPKPARALFVEVGSLDVEYKVTFNAVARVSVLRARRARLEVY